MTNDKNTGGNRWLETRKVEGDSYDATYKERAERGENVHGEANFVQSFGPKSVLDAGCGTGRVGIELARRGLDVVGVDIDENMLSTARRNGPNIEWHLADISTVKLGRRFDAIVLAGNVMIFLTPGTEGAVLANMAHHLNPEGVLITGFQMAIGYLEIDTFDKLSDKAGLELLERYSTWHRDLWNPLGNYVVSVQRLASAKSDR